MPGHGERFLATLEIVAREGRHLHYSWQHLFAEPIDARWVARLDAAPELAERLEAFAEDLGLARGHSIMLFDTYNRLRTYAQARMQMAPEELPESLPELVE